MRAADPLRCDARALKGTPEEYIQALGNAPTKVFPIKPGETIEF